MKSGDLIKLLSWSYVTAETHGFGGIEFRLNKREMGHIHGDRLVDLPFPMNTRNEPVNSGLHHLIMYYPNLVGLVRSSLTLATEVNDKKFNMLLSGQAVMTVSMLKDEVNNLKKDLLLESTSGSISKSNINNSGHVQTN
jgi:hypothetical protein